VRTKSGGLQAFKRGSTLSPGIMNALQRRSFKKMGPEEEKEAIRRAIEESEMMTQKRIQHLA